MKPIIVGHRGVAGTYPENTFASISAAADQGLTWIEVDVQPNKENELVICHDHTLDRCSNGSGRVDELTLAELKALDFGSWFNAKFSSEKIVTLEELLDFAKERELGLNIEVKLDKDIAEEVVEKLLTQLNSKSVDAAKIILSSFDPSVMMTLGNKQHQYRLGVLSEKLSAEDIHLMTQIDAYSCHLNYKNISETDIQRLRKMERKIWCFTVNDPDRFPLMEYVDAIFSDFPERF